MRVTGLDGKEYVWNLSGFRVNANDTRPRSSYHLAARAMLTELFPVSPILEEVLLPGSGSLRLDFYLPQQRVAIEVNGEQHYLPSSHFGGQGGFKASVKRDSKKAQWCENNNVKLVSLKYSDNTDAWKRQISST